MIDKALSDHFMLSEFLRSETAARQGIDNSPSDAIEQALIWNAANLEAVRSLLGVPLHISSGYRCLALNAAVGSKPTSAHVKGLAADFDAPQFGSPLAVCQRIVASQIPFDQLIWEHTWTHIGWVRLGETPRRQVLTLMPGNTYASGIVDHGKAA